MAKAFFVSDVHLMEDASPTGEALLFLLQKAREECDLFVSLGDLFDFWMGDGYGFAPKFPRIVQAFKDLRSSGVKVIMFEGNHDINLKKFWEGELGVQIAQDTLDLEYGGLRLHLEHGDLINKEDRPYLFLRKFLRNPALTYLTNVPLLSVVTRKIGERSSKVSREHSYSVDGKEAVVDRVRRYAQDLCAKKPFDLMISGHTHFEDDFQFNISGKKARSLNMGSWYEGPRYISVSGQEVKIEKFQI